MIIDVEEERLVVISDLHLGNPASTARERVVAFLDYVRSIGASLCINGDGFDMMQTSFSRLAGDALPVIKQIRRIERSGSRVYYVVGNHDLVLEHYLEDLLVTASPFLNVRSGSRRIRIEHGHVYDPFYAEHPDLYETSTKLAGYVLFANPDVYSLYTRVAAWYGGWRGSGSHYHEAADMLLRRGFDTVVFGHTHNAEVVELEHGRYVNSGNWQTGRSYVEIIDGDVQLRSWQEWRSSDPGVLA